MQTTENKTIRERNNRQTKRNKRKPKVTNYLNSKINHLILFLYISCVADRNSAEYI